MDKEEIPNAHLSIDELKDQMKLHQKEIEDKLNAVIDQFYKLSPVLSQAKKKSNKDKVESSTPDNSDNNNVSEKRFSERTSSAKRLLSWFKKVISLHSYIINYILSLYINFHIY